jgi:hypothetical protein
VWSDGTKAWYQNGELHRDGDAPAVIVANGTKYWYQHGLKYRESGPPIIIFLGVCA